LGILGSHPGKENTAVDERRRVKEGGEKKRKGKRIRQRVI